MSFRWCPKESVDKKKVEHLSAVLNVNPIIATLLVQRGIETYHQAERFFRPKLEHLHNPFLMKDMGLAVDRIKIAIDKEEKILVYGDYDVDGTTSVSVVYSFLSGFSNNLDYYIPDRYKEGYGISKIGIDWASENGFTLIIALDCGTRSVELIEYAKTLGVDFIVCDHHLPGEKLPNAVALLNPKRPDCTYPFKELSGCGIGFKLIQGLAEILKVDFKDIEQYLDLVAVSIASDIVEMRDENRVLAYYGLKRMNEEPCVGLQALMQKYQLRQEYDISDIVFGIGPRINAAGRIYSGKDAVKLLIEKDFHAARKHAEILNDHNLERKDKDNEITKEALNMIENSDAYKSRMSTVLYGPNWHKGVIGIVASRLIETYYKPTIIFSEIDGMLTGSARSVKDFDIHEAIGACSEYVIQFGGHKYAAGLSIKLEHFENFSDKFETIVKNNLTERNTTPEITYDAVINLSDINMKFYGLLDQFRPFGPGNMAPVFRTNNLKDTGQSRVVKEKHLKISAIQNQTRIDGIGFGMETAKEYLRKPFDVCYSIELNKYNGNESLQLKIKDIKPSENI